MMKFVQTLIAYSLLMACLYAVTLEARPSNALGETNDNFEAADPEADEMRRGYYESPAQGFYPNVPMDPLQMLIAQYRPTAYLRSPTWNNMNELYRMPEAKRQVRYRQCYFNPISCFKK